MSKIDSLTPDKLDDVLQDYINKCGAAFPVVDEPSGWAWYGMTLRDYFAGQALIGIAWDCGLSKAEAAETAYEFADAMLAERAKK
jgi:hypothetical protein